MRLADARRAASTMISCSISASLMDISGVEQCPWKMNTSAPRIDSPYLQCSSPLANSDRLT